MLPKRAVQPCSDFAQRQRGEVRRIQRMTRQRETPKPLEENTRVVLRRIADERVVLVVHALAGGALRFSELNRAIRGLSQKLLIQTVRALEQDGLVHREVFHQVPPRVEYSLTELGKKLRRPVTGLCEWAIENAQAFRR